MIHDPNDICPVLTQLEKLFVYEKFITNIDTDNYIIRRNYYVNIWQI